jgi:hypothetical protein
MSASQTSIYFTDQVPRRTFLNTIGIAGRCMVLAGLSAQTIRAEKTEMSAPQLAKTGRPENRAQGST